MAVAINVGMNGDKKTFRQLREPPESKAKPRVWGPLKIPRKKKPQEEGVAADG